MRKLITLFAFSPLFAISQLTCGDDFTDSGGAFSTYSDGENTTYTVCPQQAGQHVVVTFTEFNLESGWDNLNVYDNGVLIGTYTGSTIPGPFESTAADGCLTFNFTSDGSVTYDGWVATVTCVGGGGGGGSFDLSNVRSYNGNVETSYDYTLIPNSQRHAMTFGAKVANNSNTYPTGVALNVVVNDGTSNVYTGNTTFDVTTLDTQYVWLATNFTPAINKTYTVTVSIGDDNDNTNNTRTFTFQTQNDYYAHDFSTTSTYSQSALNNDFYYVNQYDAWGNGTVYSIDIKLAPGTTPNQTLRAFIADDNQFLGEGFKLITAADINNGQYTRIYLDQPVTLSNTGEGFKIYIGAGSENLTGTLNTYANANNNDDNASGVYSNGLGYYNSVDKSLAVRMNFNQGCAGFDATSTVVPAQSCAANSGRINLNISTGGTAVANQNTISWTGAGTNGSLSNQSNTASITNLAPGNYTITITNNGCSTNITASVTSTTSPTFTINEVTPITCNGQSNGAIQYTANGTTTGYNIVWNDGTTGTTLSNLGAGTYSITATNGVCNITQSYTLAEPAAIGIATTKQNVTTCGGTNGSINITASNGTTGEYVYTWTGPNTGNSGPGFGGNFSINNLSAGNYIINVSNGGCTNTTTVSISETTAPNVNIIVFEPISCNGMADGIIKVNSTSNINAYTFTWNTGATGNTISNVGAGTYSVVGTNGTCTTTANFVLADPDPIEINGASATSQINVTTSGGTAPYSFSWTGPSAYSASTEDISNLTALGNYTLTVTDANGCTESRTFNVQFLATPEQELANQIVMYPNPVSSIVTIKTPATVKDILIFNAQGQQVMNIEANDVETKINVSHLSNGVYYIQFIGEENQTITKKLSIAH